MAAVHLGGGGGGAEWVGDRGRGRHKPSRGKEKRWEVGTNDGAL
jgi:hypothetical protein